jgi:hypothetical protein
MVQMEILSGKTDSLAKYIGRMESIARRYKLSWAARLLRVYLFRFLKGRFLEYLRAMEQTRYSKQFLKQPSVRNRFRAYYRTSLNEIQRLYAQHGTDIPVPLNVIFGHTHQPIPWGSEELMTRVSGKVIRLCNTGGWLLREENGSSDFVGAEVILYETGRGVRSVSIRTDDLRFDTMTGSREREKHHRMSDDLGNVEEKEPALVLES